MTQSLHLSPEPKTKTPLIYKIGVMLGMMTLMGGTLTGVMTYINLGFSDTFFSSWLKTFAMAVTVLMPTGIIMMTLLTKLIKKRLPNSSDKKQNLIVGVFMALIMESIMALITAANTVGFADLALFQTKWLNSLLGALPVAMLLMITVSLTIKPKIESIMRG